MLRARKSEVLHTDEWTGLVKAGAAQSIAPCFLACTLF
jgi:hypothetical protein